MSCDVSDTTDIFKTPSLQSFANSIKHHSIKHQNSFTFRLEREDKVNRVSIMFI